MMDAYGRDEPRDRTLARVIPLNAHRPPEPERNPLEKAVASGLSFLRRRISGEYEVDEFGFDPDLNSSVLLPLARVLYDHWFRVELQGLEHIPEHGGALLVANHSGTVPLDAVMLQVGLHDTVERNLRLRKGGEQPMTVGFVIGVKSSEVLG